MIDRLKLVIVVPWKEQGLWYLYREVKSRAALVEVLSPLSLPARLPCGMNLRLCEFFLPVLAFFKRKHFDAVLSWSIRIGVIYGILNRLFPSYKSPGHLVRDFHLNLDRDDPIYRIKLLLVRLAIPGIDFFLCTSHREESIYAKIFGLPPGKIFFLPDAPPTQFLNQDSASIKGDYIFSYGNSDRDFPTLIKALKGIEIKTIILSQNFNPAPSDADPYIHFINEKISEKELIKLISSARLIVLPLKSPVVSAGQNSMLETMALGRPLITTSNPATSEYAKDGQTAIFFEAGEWKNLRERIQFLMDNPEKAEDMGTRAKKEMERMPDRQADILFNLLKRAFCV